MSKNQNCIRQIVAMILAISMAIPMSTNAIAKESGISVGTSIGLSSDAGYVIPGSTLEIYAAFDEVVETNAVNLYCAFDGGLLEYEDYMVADGTSIVDTRQSDGAVRITLIMQDYDAKNLGRIVLRTKEDADLPQGSVQVSLTVEYVTVDEDGDKAIQASEASISFKTLTGGKPEVEGDTNVDCIVDILDLSNIIDWFEIAKDDSAWETLYTWYDFNGNGEIDIYDIAYIARLIGSGSILSYSRTVLDGLIIDAQSRIEENYTAESWEVLQKSLETAKELSENSKATDEELFGVDFSLQV